MNLVEQIKAMSPAEVAELNKKLRRAVVIKYVVVPVAAYAVGAFAAHLVEKKLNKS